MPSKQARLDLDWAADMELLASALEAGLLPSAAIELLANRCSQTWRSHFLRFSQLVHDESSLGLALTQFKVHAQDSRVDLLAELLIASVQFGSTGLIEALHRMAENCRQSATVRDDVMSRIVAIVSVARLGAAAPWVMVALLCTRSENFDSYLNGFGPSVLIFGATVCAAALAAIHMISRLPGQSRGIAT